MYNHASLISLYHFVPLCAVTSCRAPTFGDNTHSGALQETRQVVSLTLPIMIPSPLQCLLLIMPLCALVPYRNPQLHWWYPSWYHDYALIAHYEVLKSTHYASGMGHPFPQLSVGCGSHYSVYRGQKPLWCHIPPHPHLGNHHPLYDVTTF